MSIDAPKCETTGAVAYIIKKTVGIEDRPICVRHSVSSRADTLRSVIFLKHSLIKTARKQHYANAVKNLFLSDKFKKRC